MSESNESSLLKDVAEEEVSLHVSRAVGQGLGISIAGGKGSTPYKGNDEVSCIDVLFNLSSIHFIFKDHKLVP